jgi:hypothetical protein
VLLTGFFIKPAEFWLIPSLIKGKGIFHFGNQQHSPNNIQEKNLPIKRMAKCRGAFDIGTEKGWGKRIIPSGTGRQTKL